MAVSVNILQGEPMTLVGVDGFDPANTVVEMPREGAMDPQSLFWNTSRRFVGLLPTLALLSPKIGGIQSFRQHKGDYYELTANFNGLVTGNAAPTPAQLNAQIQFVWSLQPARLTKDLWEKPSAVNALNKITNPHLRAWMRSAIETIARGEMRMPPLPKDAPPAINSKAADDTNVTFQTAIDGVGLKDAGAIAELAAQLACRSRGVTSYPVASVVLRKTRIAPPQATDAAPDFDGFGRVMTTARLLRVEPTIIPIIRAGILRVTPVTAGYWFKEMPALDQRDATRVDVDTQWTFADNFDPYPFGPLLT